MIGLILVLGLAANGVNDLFELSRSSVDGGGAMRSTGGDFELSGTIGQHDAGVLHGSDFTLSAGFWFEQTGIDCDDDGLVTLLDHRALLECWTGPSGKPVSACGCFDADRTGSVDLLDFAIAQRAHGRSD